MVVSIHLPLETAIETVALSGIVIGHRYILPEDEGALMPEEAPAFASSVNRVRSASGAARIVVRQLLGRLGRAPCAVPKGPGGVPIWPPGIVGSLAHDSQVAVAALARRQDFASIGIDIEPAEELPTDLVELVATPTERSKLSAFHCGGRLLFVVKEAIYKAVAPLDKLFLDHHDVEVDFSGCQATVCNGRIVKFRFIVSTHLLALAYIPQMRAVR
jgi:4'-phosphopantetheinyl transferase EntD